jgi:ferredoxin
MSAPEVYELDPEDGHSIVMLDPVPPEHEAGARLGVDSCPERAISVVSAAVGAANHAD